MLKKPHYMAIGLVALLTLVLLNLPHHAAGQLKLAVGSLFIPFFGLSRSGHLLAERIGGGAVSRADLLREIDELRRTNQVLQLRAAEAAALQRENDQLRQALGWRRQLPWNGRLARVIARDPANWWQTVRIDVGKGDFPDIREDLPVLTPRGALVGRISAVGAYSSEVVLIGNPYCKVSALVDKSGENGIILGAAGPLDNTTVILSYLPSKSISKPGQNILTSDLGTIFPKGILIGQIMESPRTVGAGDAEAPVRLAVDLSALEYVFVLTK